MQHVLNHISKAKRRIGSHGDPDIAKIKRERGGMEIHKEGFPGIQGKQNWA